MPFDEGGPRRIGATSFTTDEAEAILWAARCGIQTLRDEGFPEPARTNVPILEAVVRQVEEAMQVAL